jgi:serine phosphatase RsbU (regulator of sigma subunit)
LWQAIGRDVTEQRRVWAERERALRSEREIAEVLQHAILGPACLPAAFAVRYQPAIRALEVGGDWYDVITRPDGEFGVVLGDVVGLGVAAAATMGQLRSAARTLLVEGHGPGRVLAVLDTVAGLTPQARCATVFCAVITPQTGTVRYSSAGHPPAILDDPARGHRLLEDAQSVPLAVREAVERPETDTPLPAGSTLLCYTDGLIERRGESLDVGIAAAAGMLQTARGLAPAEVVERLTSGLVDPDHDDDVALLIYRQSAAALQATGKKPG